MCLNRHAEEEDINAPPPQIQAAIKNNDIGNLLDLDWDAPTETPTSPIMNDGQQQQGGSLSDLLSIGNSEAQTSPRTNNNSGNIDDIMSLFNSPTSGVQQQPQQSFANSPNPPQYQQQQNVMNDFTNDLFGSSPIQQQQPQQQQQNNTTKDPFADLF